MKHTILTTKTQRREGGNSLNLASLRLRGHSLFSWLSLAVFIAASGFPTIGKTADETSNHWKEAEPPPSKISKHWKKPNLAVILVDDMGWNDPGDRPNIDRLAKTGMTFTQAYAAAPNCAPTRACLMTGQYTPRHGVYTVVDDRHAPGSPHHKIMAAESNADLATEALTIAEVLKKEGYSAGMVGMWNLGRNRNKPCTPTGQGFDSYVQPKDLGFGKDAYWDNDGNYLTDRMTDACIEFVEKQKEPFFLYFAPHSVHSPFDPKPELLKKYSEQAEYAATVEALDQNLGRLFAALPENTVIIFTSDNGGTRRVVEPLRGGKGTLYEGGLRVPMIITGPGIKGRSDEPVSSIDIFPTLCELAGVPMSGNIEGWRLSLLDGESLVPLWNGGELERDTLFWHFPCYIGQGGPSSAIRKGHWKLIEFFETQTVELYDLSKDESERRDLSAKEPKVAEELYAELKKVQAELAAPRPLEPNPDFDPSSIRKKGRGERGKGRNKK